MYLVTGRSLRWSRKSEFCESGQSRLSIGDVREIGTKRSLEQDFVAGSAAVFLKIGF